MEKVKTISKKQNRIIYFAFTLSGLLVLILTQEFSWAGVALALALIFNPFPDRPFPELSIGQKSIILAQMVIALLLIGMAFFL